MKLSKNVKIIALVTIAVVMVGAFIVLQPVEDLDEGILYEYTVYVYPSDLSDAPEDWQISVSTWEASSESAQLASVEEDAFVEALVLSRYQYNERYVYKGTGLHYMNSTKMNRWRWVVLANNGTIDHVYPGNNMWNGTMHMNQNMNQNMWDINDDAESDNWTYRFRQTFGAYTVEIELLGY